MPSRCEYGILGLPPETLTGESASVVQPFAVLLVILPAPIPGRISLNNLPKNPRGTTAPAIWNTPTASAQPARLRP